MGWVSRRLSGVAYNVPPAVLALFNVGGWSLQRCFHVAEGASREASTQADEKYRKQMVVRRDARGSVLEKDCGRAMPPLMGCRGPFLACAARRSTEPAVACAETHCASLAVSVTSG